ncbi:MAG: glycosyltransferase, partial [Candidatus Competibacteraceae bacterium]|nr:glycosyltransferase [Candidatus Competibacteraceae bacterium]
MRTVNVKPRLLVLTSTFPRWLDDSEPPFVFELSRRLTGSFDVTVLAPRAPGSQRKESMAGLHVIRFPYFIPRWENLAAHGGGILNRLKANKLNYLLIPFFIAGQIWALTQLLRRESFDIIHAHWIIPQGLVAILGHYLASQNIPIVCTSHGGDLYALRNP